MYLMRIGASGAEKPVARIDDETYVDLSDQVEDFDEAFFGAGGVDRIASVVAERAESRTVSRFAGERIGAPIARPHQILCVGLNYRDHAAETGQAVPDRADPLQQGAQHVDRTERRRTHSARIHQAGLGGGARHRHRSAYELPQLR